MKRWEVDFYLNQERKLLNSLERQAIESTKTYSTADAVSPRIYEALLARTDAMAVGNTRYQLKTDGVPR